MLVLICAETAMMDICLNEPLLQHCRTGLAHMLLNAQSLVKDGSPLSTLSMP